MSGCACCNMAPSRTACVSSILLVLMLFSCHIILYISIGYYNTECYISPTKYQAYRNLFQQIVKAYDKLDQVYWVDHGLLLGYYRHKDMLPHDGDLDLGRIFAGGKEHDFDVAFNAMLMKNPETYGNSMIGQMNYTGPGNERVYVTADLFRYEIKTIGGVKQIVPYWNKHHKNTTRYKWFERHLDKNLPYDVVFPLRRLEFLGINTSFPNKIEELVSIRYKNYKIPIPYKWRCYVTLSKISFLLLIVAAVFCITKSRKYIAGYGGFLR